MAADYMERLGEILNLEFITLKKKNWDDSFRSVRKREGDLLPAATITPPRSEFLNFTTHYIENPVVLLTRQNVKPVRTLDSLEKEPLE